MIDHIKDVAFVVTFTVVMMGLGLLLIMWTDVLVGCTIMAFVFGLLGAYDG